MPHVTISLYIQPIERIVDVQKMMESWLFTMSDVENEIHDPFTGKLIGSFVFEPDSVAVKVKKEKQ
jgi:hypothetical protein